MKLGLTAGYAGKNIEIPWPLIKKAEDLGYDSVWTAEAYGSDAVTPAAYMLARTERIKVGTAIMQMPARTPACTAMTAMTLHQLSNGRFLLGLGPSGPQVIEGWHGVAYGRPLTRTKEYVAILRKIFAREEAVTFHGQHYQLPYMGEDATGLGKPLKSILSPAPEIPIYTASIAPAGIETSAEVADGVIPVWMNPGALRSARGAAAEGLRQGRQRQEPEVLRRRAVRLGGDGRRRRAVPQPDQARARPLHRRHGRARQELLQRLRQTPRLRRRGEEDPGPLPERQAGRGGGSRARRPDRSGGAGRAKARIKDRLSAWIDAGKKGHVGTMVLGCRQPEALEFVAEQVL